MNWLLTKRYNNIELYSSIMLAMLYGSSKISLLGYFISVVMVLILVVILEIHQVRKK